MQGVLVCFSERHKRVFPHQSKYLAPVFDVPLVLRAYHQLRAMTTAGVTVVAEPGVLPDIARVLAPEEHSITFLTADVFSWEDVFAALPSREKTLFLRADVLLERPQSADFSPEKWLFEDEIIGGIVPKNATHWPPKTTKMPTAERYKTPVDFLEYGLKYGENAPAAPGEKPLVRIGIVAYNAEKYVRACLDSLLKSDYENLEIVITDNASTDRTAAFLAEYEDRVTLLQNAENVGFARAHNAMISGTKAKYYACF